MKNRVVKFTSDADVLTVSIHKGKQHIRVSVRYKEKDEKQKVGPKKFFELNEETEAEKVFDEHVKDALSKGWVLHGLGRQGPSFTSIPYAPGYKAGNGDAVKDTAKTNPKPETKPAGTKPAAAAKKKA